MAQSALCGRNPTVFSVHRDRPGSVADVVAPSRSRSTTLAGKALVAGLPAVAPTVAVVALVGCLLVPLPTVLVDVLLSLSLAGSVLLMVASLAVRRTTDFIAFPALLLLATLFRLALNVSTTRLILSDAYAGRVVDAFAGVVVRDDLIVGGVMFAIITIIQFVVIARGAERVAEVGARFALDGLPGHQAAIEADLRSGVITPTEASRRRARLVERSSFYGAMDGTIRFVRGDAVAGLAITATNLLGGIAVGMLRLGLPWSECLEVYGRLTIGDGLLSQLPALLLSLAAGILVARVDRSDEPRRRKASDLWLEPSMLLVPALLLLALCMVPAMPRLAFGGTSIALLAAALLLSFRVAAERRVRVAPVEASSVRVRLHPSHVTESRVIERALAEVRLQCGYALGLEVPPIVLWTDEGQRRGFVEVLIDGRSCGRASCASGQKVEDEVVISTFRLIMEHAGALVDLEDIDRMVEEVRPTHPAIVRRALQTVEANDVLRVVRGFLEERIPLPPMRFVLSAIAEGERFREPHERALFPELVRERLAEHWVHAVLDTVRTIGEPRFVRLTPDAEDVLAASFRYLEDGPRLRLSATERRAWLLALELVLDPRSNGVSVSQHGAPLVLVTSARGRKAASLLTAGALPHVPVLSDREFQIAGERVSVRWLDPPDPEEGADDEDADRVGS